jgi:hypothetical protein
MDGGFQAVRAAGENLLIPNLKKRFLYGKFWDFLTIWWKAPFWLVENKKRKRKKKTDIKGTQLEDRQIQDLQLCTPWTGMVL